MILRWLCLMFACIASKVLFRFTVKETLVVRPSHIFCNLACSIMIKSWASCNSYLWVFREKRTSWAEIKFFNWATVFASFSAILSLVSPISFLSAMMVLEFSRVLYLKGSMSWITSLRTDVTNLKSSFDCLRCFVKTLTSFTSASRSKTCYGASLVTSCFCSVTSTIKQLN